MACANCKAPCDGRIHLYLHISSGRRPVDVISSFYWFCSAACRDAWYDASTTEDVVPLRPADPRELALHEGDGDLLVTVLQDGQRHPDGTIDGVAVVRDGVFSHTLPGIPRAQHRFARAPDLNAWWRGELHAEPLPELATR